MCQTRLGRLLYFIVPDTLRKREARGWHPIVCCVRLWRRAWRCWGNRRTPVEWPASFTHHANPEELSHARQTVLSQIIENRKVEAHKSLTFRYPTLTFCLKKANLRQNPTGSWRGLARRGGTASMRRRTRCWGSSKRRRRRRSRGCGATRRWYRRGSGASSGGNRSLYETISRTREV